MKFKTFMSKEPKHKATVTSVDWSTSEEVYSCSDDHTLLKWNLTIPETVTVTTLPADFYPTDLNCCPRLSSTSSLGAVPGKQVLDTIVICSSDGRNSGTKEPMSDNIIDTKIDIVYMIYEKTLHKCANCKYESEFYSSFVVHKDSCNESPDVISNIKCYDIKQEDKLSCSENLSFAQEYDDPLVVKDEIIIEDMEFEKVYHKCSNCDFGTESYCTFQVHVSTCRKSLNPPNIAMKVFKCRVCKKMFDARYDLTMHHRLHRRPKLKKKRGSQILDKAIRFNRKNKVLISANKQYECTSCPKTFEYASYLARHMIKHSVEKQFSCDICKKKFKRKYYLKWHIRDQHGKQSLDTYQGKLYLKKNLTPKQSDINKTFEHTRQRVKTRYPCKVCNKAFNKEKNLNAHMKSAHDKNECEICHETFTLKSDLNNHTRSVHLVNKYKHECEVCHKTYSRKMNLITHMESVHDKIRHECQVCHKTFTQRSNLITHIKSVHIKIEHECEICHQKFSHMSTLYSHTILEHDGIKKDCKICHKTFNDKYSLSTHMMLIHRDEMRYECKICHQTFINLKNHMRSVHCKSKHECEICHKEFSMKYYLNTHVASVHDKIKHECDICHKGFSQKAALKAHKTTHDKTGPQCPICHKMFTHKRSLDANKSSVHDKIKLECQICHKLFSRKYTLDIHKSSVHDKIKHECEICHRTFSLKCNLNVHRSSTHDKIKHECVICHKSFTKKWNLSVHMKSVHS